ncbi:MAG TPA: hypothetical protein VNS32_20455, partial [Flavisolibacter sp.]|nr:hypothetical protein [Flavisolibacter sp.]
EIMNTPNLSSIKEPLIVEQPKVSNVEQKDVLVNFIQIKREVNAIIATEMERMLDTPELADLIIKK